MNLNKKIKPPQKGMIDFTRGARTAIYKPVLLKSILALSIINNSPKIDINEITEKFIRILWDFRKKFHLSLIQSGRSAAIDSIIAKIDKKALKKKLSQEIIDEVQKKVLFRDVIYRLRNDTGFYEFLDEKSYKINAPLEIKDESEFRSYKDLIKYLELNGATFNYFKNNLFIIERFIEFEIARQLEKFNDVPRIIEKVRFDNKPRKNVSEREHNLLLDYQSKRCFYCNQSLNEDISRQIHEDHFIPWSFVYETYIYNIVLSCSECNEKKKDKIAVERFKDILINRNNEVTFQDKFWKIYKDNRNWKKEGREGISKFFSRANETIKLHYDRCIQIFDRDWKP